MGDFSRDTFRETNVLHQTLSGVAVSNPRHYVGVRLQQGVPLLDSDWNEMEDIHHAEVRALLHYFIGNGIPENNQGFSISGSGASNDFTINAGVAVIDGHLVVAPQIVTYSTQPYTLTAGVAPLTTPPIGNNRRDLVYLDVWNEEIGAAIGFLADERIVNQAIGIETATRIERRWAVRVLEGIGTTWQIPEAGDGFEHHYMELAIIQRRENFSTILDSMIIDRRHRGLTLREHLKVPLFVSRGIEQVDKGRFALMVANLRRILLRRLRENLIPYQIDASDERAEMLIIVGLQQLAHLAQVGENQADAGNLNNTDALAFMGRLYAEQNAWLGLLEEFGNEADTAAEFIEDYREHLDGTSTIPGLSPALGNDDLLAAILAQEQLNQWLAGNTGLPSGSVIVSYAQAVPFNEPLSATATTDFIYNVSIFFPTPSGSDPITEQFTVEVLLDGGFGTADVDPAVLTLDSPGGQRTITVTVAPGGALLSADMEVLVRSASNPSIVSPPNTITLTRGVVPPTASFYIYTGPRFNFDGLLELPSNLLPNDPGVALPMRIINNSETDQRTYRIDVHLENLSNGDAGDWNWTDAPTQHDALQVLNPGGIRNLTIPLQWTEAGNPPTGTTGVLVTSATTTIGDSTETSTVELPFIVV